ncbi:MAG: hypothetical protein ACJ8AT_13850 [Hyalangium sp.]|uniref:hypothetical protein n=1 Tax=Hyalangium sp. TaxID=2028555 RepID=UPI00389A3597
MARRRRQLLPWIFSGALLVAAVGLVVAKLEESTYHGRPREIDDPPMDPAQRSFQDIKRVEKESSNQEHLTAAQTALAEKKLAEAKAELDNINPDTLMFEQVSKQKRALQDAAEARVREAQALLDAHQLDQAVAIADDVLAAFPENAAAKHISEQRPPPVPIADPPPPFWEEAVDQFVRGDVDGAITLAKACAATSPPCKSGLKDLTEFASLNKNPAAVDAQKMRRLLELEKSIQGPTRPSRVAQSAGPIAARMFYQAAVKAKAAHQWARAVDYALQTLKADRSHAGATQLLADLKLKAQELFLEAYSVKTSSPESAIPKFRLVMALTPPEDDMHRKAEQWLMQIQR